MAIYQSEHTGTKIDEVIGGVFKDNPVVINADEAVGDEKLYVNGKALITDLEVTGTISGSVATTLIGLTDTPAAYDDGKYLRSTASGTEWATVSGGTTDHSTLSNLDYASSGHTGFFSSTAATTLSGSLQTNIDGKADTLHTHTSDQVYLHAEQSLDDIIDFQAAGQITGFTITSGTNANTAKVAAGTCWLKESNSATAEIHYYSVAEQDNIPAADGDVTYFYVDYNGGSPLVSGTITKADINNRSKIGLGRAYNNGGTLQIVNAGMNIDELAKRVQSRFNYVDGAIVRSSGMILSETGTRNIAITAGVLYAGLTQKSTGASDTSGTDTFYYFYRDGGTGWTMVDSQTQIDNTYYDDDSGTLHALTSNRYGVHWVFQSYADCVAVVYGQGDYTLAEAQAAAIPSSLPDCVSEFALIIGKIIIQQGASTFYSTESAFTEQFNVAGVTDHGDLSGLEDDDHTQYHNDTRGDARYYTQAQITSYLADKFDSAGGTISGNVTIQGNLTVTGTEFITHVEEVEIDDNLLLINANETGGGVTKGWAGIEVDRGTETNYQFMFIEADDNFQVGISGSLQPVATRKDSSEMTDTYVPYWDAANYRFITDNSVAYDEIATDADLATVSGALHTEIDTASGTLQSNIDAKLTDVVDDTSPDLGGNLTMGAYNILTTAAPSSDHTASGLIASMTVGESVVFGDALYMKSDGKLWKADASAYTTMPVMAIAIASISADAAGNVLLQGFVRDDTYAFTVGGIVYASATAGAVTQTAPSSSGDVVQHIGVATHADRFLFNPSYATGSVA